MRGSYCTVLSLATVITVFITIFRSLVLDLVPHAVLEVVFVLAVIVGVVTRRSPDSFPFPQPPHFVTPLIMELSSSSDSSNSDSVTMQHMHRSSSSRSPAYRELIARMSSPAKRFDPNRTRCGVGACKQVPLLFALGVHPSTPVDYDALRLILSLEATNPNAVDDDGHTALWIASFKGSDAAVEMLLDRAECLDTVEEDGGFVHADCNRPASDGSTPLHAAAYNNSTACIAALVAFAPLRTMDVNARTKGGSTALRAAAHAALGVEGG